MNDDEYTPEELAEIDAVMPDADKLRQGAIDHPPPPEYFEGNMPRPW
jgi:hypothetical protein